MTTSKAEREAYQRDGVVLLREAFDRDWIGELLQGFSQNLDDPGPMSRRFADEGEGRVFLWDTILWPRIEKFKQFAECSPAAEIAAELMNSNEIRLLNDVIFHRTAGTQARPPYHQDTP